MKILFITLFLIAGSSAFAATYYVSPSGSDNNSGSITSPFLTLNKAWTVVAAGDIVYMRGGTYNYPKQILTGKSGSSGNYIKLWAYPGETPVIKKSGSYAGSSWPRSIIRVSGNYIHVKGLEICYNTQETGDAYIGIINLDGNYNIYELLNLHHNGGMGLSIEYNSTGNLVLNCDVHHNSDPLSPEPYGDADGIGLSHIPGGLVNTIRGCRLWWNTDDGVDPYGCDSRLIIENCWSWNNGYIPDTYNTAGNGNGFKLGTTASDLGTAKMMLVKNNIAAKNRTSGFHQNGARAVIELYNNTAYSNGAQGFYFASYNKPHVLKNNISYKNVNYCSLSAESIVSNNTFLQNNTANPAYNVTDDDFLSFDISQLGRTRKSDGSLPDIDYLHLKSTSDLIDRGINVNLPYSGTAPDLGAFETSLTASTVTSLSYVSSTIDKSVPDVIRMSYNVTLANILPSASCYSVKVNSVLRSVSKLVISGKDVLLTLSVPAIYGDIITVSYTKPSTNPLQCLNATFAESIVDKPVTNLVEASIPGLLSSIIESATPDRIDLTYNMPLANIIPAVSAFIVKVNSMSLQVVSVAVSTNKILLKLAAKVVFGDNVTISYTKPSINPIQSLTGALALSFTSQIVKNNILLSSTTTQKEILIYPKIVREYLTVENVITSDKTLKIFDDKGHLWMEKSLEAGVTNKIPVNLQKGNYVVQVLTGSVINVAQKMVVV